MTAMALVLKQNDPRANNRVPRLCGLRGCPASVQVTLAYPIKNALAQRPKLRRTVPIYRDETPQAQLKAQKMGRIVQSWDDEPICLAENSCYPDFDFCR
jgi:hypothetical protein